MSDWKLAENTPFGAVVTAEVDSTGIDTFPKETLKTLVDTHAVLVFRGFAPLEGDALPEYCATLGAICQFEFGAVNKLESSPEAKNYLYTNAAVPFHWDGAFLNQVPHYIFFHCDTAPPAGSGGETLFANTKLMLEYADEATREVWTNVSITYSTEKIVHYGGEFRSPMIERSPLGDDVIRYAEPVTDLNPVSLTIEGITDGCHDNFVADMHERLHSECVCYRHEWQSGDIVIADNFTLLHGRLAFKSGAPRSIRRVNIL